VSESRGSQHHRVSWFELFYDLVLVAAVVHGSDVYGEHPTWTNAFWASGTLVILFLLWLMTNLTFNVRADDSVIRRLVILGQMAAVVIASLAMDRHNGLPDSDGFLALGAAFASVAVLYAMTARRDAKLKPPALVVAWSCAIGAFILECGYVLPSDEGSANPIAAIAVLALGVLVSALPAVTVFLGHLVRVTGLDQEHLSERTAQFVLIVLGETFLGLILNLHELNSVPNIPMFALTFVIVYCMWSTYFSSVIPGGVPATLGRVQLWLSAHVLFMIGAVGVSSALSALTLIPLAERLPEVSAYRLPLPLFWMLLALAILTWLSRAAARRLVWLHCGIAVAIVAMGVVGALWFPTDLVLISLLASLLVIVDAVAAARMTQLKLWTAATSSP
jgi:low temperature requirement protein LtrA